MSTPSKINITQLVLSSLFLKEPGLTSILASRPVTQVVAINPLLISAIYTSVPPLTISPIPGLWQPGGGEYLPNALICINAEPLITLTGENLVYV